MMIGILELLILVVVVPVVILMAAAVVRYLSQQNVSRLLIFGGLAVLVPFSGRSRSLYCQKYVLVIDSKCSGSNRSLAAGR